MSPWDYVKLVAGVGGGAYILQWWISVVDRVDGFWTPFVLTITLTIAAATVVMGIASLVSKDNDDIPSVPGALPFLGNVGIYRDVERFTSNVEAAVKRYENDKGFTSLRLPSLNPFGQRVILVNNKDAIQQMLTRRPTTFERPQLLVDVMHGMLGFSKDLSVFTSGGFADWGRARRITSPSFNHTNVATMKPQCFEVAASLVQRWLEAAKHYATGDVVDALEDFNLFTFSVVAQVGFGLPFDALSSDSTLQDTREGAPKPLSTLLPDLKETTKHQGDWTLNPLLQVLDPLFSKTKLNETLIKRDRVRDYLDELIEFEKKQLEEGGHSKSLLSKLSDPATKLTAEEVISNFTTYFFAGVDTTAVGLSWSICYAALDRSLQRKLAEEADAAGVTAWIRARLLGSKQQDLPFSDVGIATLLSNSSKNPLKLARGVFLEALRLHPPASQLGADVGADGAELMGYRFEPGTLMFQMLRNQMCSERNNVKDPASFSPERWCEDSPDKIDDAFLSALMFGGGPRICPGRHLSVLEASIVLSCIFSHLEVHNVSGGAALPAEVTRFTMQPEMALVRVSRRIN